MDLVIYDDEVAAQRRQLLQELFGDYDDGDGSSSQSDSEPRNGGDDIVTDEVIPAGEMNVDLHEESHGDEDENGIFMDTIYSAEEIDEGPKAGMTFETVDDLFHLYKAHSRLKGFCVTRRSRCKRVSGEEVKYVYITCDRGRTKPANSSRSKRNQCKARVRAYYDRQGKVVVRSIVHEHNHELVPDTSRIIAGHRQLNRAMKRRLIARDRAGIRPSKSIRMEEVEAGGPDRMGCIPEDCRNFINSTRACDLKDGDAECMRQFFLDMQRKDPDFFHLMDLDDSGHLRNVLWIHPQQRAAYKDFHDVVCFDTTYLVNKYDMPFATFVGVNNHHQSILLGSALVSRENVETFKWLFSAWKSAMGDVAPSGLLTDQCESIKAAVRDVFPETAHRFCIWHITTKLPVRLRSQVQDWVSCKKEFYSMVRDSLTEFEFETRWASFLDVHQLHNNEWLNKLYGERTQWVPVYLKDFFWAGMKSTQRSEGMHSFFDGFLGRGSTLSTFAKQYEVALRVKFEKELKLDHRSRYTTLACITQFPWELQLSRVLTHTLFLMFQEQVNRLHHCDILGTEQIMGTEILQVQDTSIRNSFYNNEITYTVEHNRNDDVLRCNCGSFESGGLLCCHILKVMIRNNVHEVPERYILRRWRIDVPRPHLKKFFCGGYPSMTDEYKAYRELQTYFDCITDHAIDSITKLGYVKEILSTLKYDILHWDERTMGHSYVLDDNVAVQGAEDASTQPSGSARASTQPTEQAPNGQGSILDPRITRRRGRPRSIRYPSTYDHAHRARVNGRNVAQNNNASGSGRGRGASGSGRGRGTVARGSRGGIGRGVGRGGGQSGGRGYGRANYHATSGR